MPRSALTTVVLLLLLALVQGCSNDHKADEARAGAAAEGPTKNSMTQGSVTSAALEPLIIGRFSSDELFQAGGGGCGLSLWEPGTSPFADGFVFFHGLGDAQAFILVDGELRRLSLSASGGEEIFGRQTDQTFTGEDGAISVQLTVVPGPQDAPEFVPVQEGRLVVRKGDRLAELAVVGDAGC